MSMVCPHVYYEEIDVSYEKEYCGINGKECKLKRCMIYKAFKKKKDEESN